MISEFIPRFPQHQGTNSIYISCLIFLTLSITLLPFIKTDVSIRSQGLIRPSAEVLTLRSITSGKIRESRVSENIKVLRGDTLFILESELLQEQLRFVVEKLDHEERISSDLKQLISQITTHDTGTPDFYFPTYHQEYTSYLQKLKESSLLRDHAKKIFERQARLFSEKVIAKAEFEAAQFEMQKSEEGVLAVAESCLDRWHHSLKQSGEFRQELKSQQLKLQKEMGTQVILAPVNGTVLNLTGHYHGIIVSNNQELGQISPDTSMLAIAYVSPGDVGMLKNDMTVKMQVDAFNYNQWGFISGSILSVPHDVKVINNEPVFEVRCKLSQNYLQLKNGYKGFLRKGMTLQVRFLISRRSLWQLLWDHVDDWINPNLSSAKI